MPNRKERRRNKAQGALPAQANPAHYNETHFERSCRRVDRTSQELGIPRPAGHLLSHELALALKSGSPGKKIVRGLDSQDENEIV